jgi:hypothetical protein
MRQERASAFVPVALADGATGAVFDARVVAALRCYAATRAARRAPLPEMIAMAAGQGLVESATVALASVFELTEACLGRALATGEGAALSADETGVLLLLASAEEVGSHSGSRAVPHGMPGALAWAARSAVRLTGGVPARPAARPDCPFRH